VANVCQKATLTGVQNFNGGVDLGMNGRQRQIMLKMAKVGVQFVPKELNHPEVEFNQRF